MKQLLLVFCILSLNVLSLTKEQESFIRVERQKSMNMQFWSETRELGTVAEISNTSVIVKLSQNVYFKEFWISIEGYMGENLSDYPNVVPKLELIEKVKFSKKGKSVTLPLYHSPKYYDSNDVDIYVLNMTQLTKEQEAFLLDGGYSIQFLSQSNKIIFLIDTIEDNSVSDEIYKKILKESKENSIY